jgi:hypothetical protein
VSKNVVRKKLSVAFRMYLIPDLIIATYVQYEIKFCSQNGISTYRSFVTLCIQLQVTERREIPGI